MREKEVFITKSGFEIRSWDPVAEQTVKLDPEPMSFHIRSACHIEPGVTLGDLFRAVHPHKDLIAIVNLWCSCNAEVFHAEAAKPSSNPSTLRVIEISKDVEVHEGSSGTGQESVHVHGLGPSSEKEAGLHGVEPGEETSWGIDFMPVNDLANVPIVLKEKGSLEVWMNPDDPEYRTPGPDGEPRFFRLRTEYRAFYTLLDVMEIYYEVSFHGSPEHRDERMSELAAAVAEIESLTEEEREERLVPFERPPDVIN